jgi:single-strand DNA-binding protein
MANDLNQCTFIGRLGRDPEARTFPSGDMVCNFSIGVGEQWKDKNTGEKKESTEWVNIVAGGKLAEICSQYLQKGAQVMITGKMKTRKWEKDGVTRYQTEIRADSMQMLGGKPSGNDGYSDNQGQPARQPAPQRQAPAPKRASSGFDDMDDPDSKIPF